MLYVGIVVALLLPCAPAFATPAPSSQEDLDEAEIIVKASVTGVDCMGVEDIPDEVFITKYTATLSVEESIKGTTPEVIHIDFDVSEFVEERSCVGSGLIFPVGTKGTFYLEEAEYEGFYGLSIPDAFQKAPDGASGSLPDCGGSADDGVSGSSCSLSRSDTGNLSYTCLLLVGLWFHARRERGCSLR